jgi:hypothetical protein
MNSKLIFTNKNHSSNDSLSSIEAFGSRSCSIDSSNGTDYNLNNNSTPPKEKLFKSLWKPIVKRRKREEQIQIVSSPKVEDVLMKLYIKNDLIKDSRK